MPSTSNPPAYRHYKPKNLAVVRLNGKDHYLGEFNSQASWRKYYRLILEYLEPSQRQNIVEEEGAPRPPPLTIKRLCLLYFEFAEQDYVKEGRQTSEVTCLKHALRRLLKLFGDEDAAKFGPKKLKMVRDEFIRDGLSRKTVNNNVSRLKRMFAWAVANELLHVTVFQALATVENLKKGKGGRETKRVRPVPDGVVNATLAFLPAPVKAMVELQRITGCRPGEICSLRPCDLHRDGDLWWYEPESHKTEHFEHERRIYLGPRAQRILQPWLDRGATDFCFSPREAEQIRRQLQHADRKTPFSYGNRPGTNRKAAPKRAPGERYTTDSYRRAIARACKAAKVTRWKPNQIRHTRATEVAKLADRDAARVVLGHHDPRVTDQYAETDFMKAAAYMRIHG